MGQAQVSECRLLTSPRLFESSLQTQVPAVHVRTARLPSHSSSLLVISPLQLTRMPLTWTLETDSAPRPQRHQLPAVGGPEVRERCGSSRAPGSALCSAGTVQGESGETGGQQCGGLPGSATVPRASGKQPQTSLASSVVPGNNKPFGFS